MNVRDMHVNVAVVQGHTFSYKIAPFYLSMVNVLLISLVLMSMPMENDISNSVVDLSFWMRDD